MDTALAIFVKTPGYSDYKTRLRVELGEEITSEFYRKCIDINKDILLGLSDIISPFWAVAEEEALNDQLWCDLTTVDQGVGCLGKRLSVVYEELFSKYSIVIFMGTDSPHISEVFLRESIINFKQSDSDFLLGRTEDGGFYIFGSKVSIPKEVWVNTPYSVNSTSDILEKEILKIGKVMHLPINFDIDEAEVLKKYRTLTMTNLSAKQIELIHWSNQVINGPKV